jgi:hypothetical protein
MVNSGWTEQKANAASLIERGATHRARCHHFSRKAPTSCRCRQAEAEARAVEERENITLAQVWEKYLPVARPTKPRIGLCRGSRLPALALPTWPTNPCGTSNHPLERIKKTMAEADRSAQTIGMSWRPAASLQFRKAHGCMLATIRFPGQETLCRRSPTIPDPRRGRRLLAAWPKGNPMHTTWPCLPALRPACGEVFT